MPQNTYFLQQNAPKKKKNRNKMHTKFDEYDNLCIFGGKCTTRYYERIT